MISLFVANPRPRPFDMPVSVTETDVILDRPNRLWRSSRFSREDGELSRRRRHET